MRETDNFSIHTKRYYLVILEGIDPKRETVESFAIKLSMRTRTTLPRVRQILRNLPYTIKKGVSMAQANRLKNVIEEIGGQVRLEPHFVTPGDGREQPGPDAPASAPSSSDPHRPPREELPKPPAKKDPALAADSATPIEGRQAKELPKPEEPPEREAPATGTLGDEIPREAITCPACGWEEESGATYCSLCLRRFRDQSSRRPGLDDKIPEENPLRARGDATKQSGIVDGFAWQEYKLLLIAGGVLLALILFIIIK